MGWLKTEGRKIKAEPMAKPRRGGVQERDGTLYFKPPTKQGLGRGGTARRHRGKQKINKPFPPRSSDKTRRSNKRAGPTGPATCDCGCACGWSRPIAPPLPPPLRASWVPARWVPARHQVAAALAATVQSPGRPRARADHCKKSKGPTKRSKRGVKFPTNTFSDQINTEKDQRTRRRR